MYLRFPQVKIRIIPFAGSKGNIKDPGLGFEGQPQPASDEIIVEIASVAVIDRPACINEGKQERIQAYEIAIFQSAYRVP